MNNKENPAGVSPNSLLLMLCLCALVAGFLAFTLTDYRASTLVLEATTAQNGNGMIIVDGADPRQRKILPFSVQAELAAYVLELPAVPLDSVRIFPPATSGDFSVTKVTLANDVVSYHWNDADDCSQKQLRNKQIVRSKCDPQHPALNLGNDGSVLISAIPDSGIRRTTQERLMIAILSASGLFIAGICLLLIARSATHLQRWQLYWSMAVWCILLSVYVAQFCNIYTYSVDVPFSDDWLFFGANGLKEDLSLRWLFRPELEHRIVLTKLQGWVNLRLFSLDYRLQKIVNYLLFGGIVLALAFLKNKLVGKGRFILFPMFLIFLLSPIAWENHRWALQSDYHFAVLFACLALCYLFPPEITLKSCALFCLFSGLSMYSLAPGAVLAAVCVCCSVVCLMARMGDKAISSSLHRLQVVQILAMGLIFCTWLYGYKRLGEDWPHKYVFPWEPGYWADFLNMVSFSFGFQEHNLALGIVCLCVLMIPLVLLLQNSETRWQSITWSLVAGTAGILVVFAAVTMARSGVNYYGAKTSRYAEIGFLLIPLMAMAWWRALRSRTLQWMVLTLLWIFCFVGYRDNWTSLPYQETKQYDLQTLECAENYYRGTGDGTCRGETFPNAQLLDRAKELGVNFTKQFVDTAPR